MLFLNQILFLVDLFFQHMLMQISKQRFKNGDKKWCRWHDPLVDRTCQLTINSAAIRPSIWIILFASGMQQNHKSFIINKRHDQKEFSIAINFICIWIIHCIRIFTHYTIIYTESYTGLWKLSVVFSVVLVSVLIQPNSWMIWFFEWIRWEYRFFSNRMNSISTNNRFIDSIILIFEFDFCVIAILCHFWSP